MSEAVVALIVMLAIAAGFVAVMIAVDRRRNRIRQERRERWAAMGYGEARFGGAALGGVYGACAGGAGGGGGGGGCGGGAGCGGGGCGGGGGGCGGGGGG